MSAEDATTASRFPRNRDRSLLGLEVSDAPDEVFTFAVSPHLCRIDGHLYGGAAATASIAAIEAAAERPALWCSTQLVGSAELGSCIRVEAQVVAAGKTVAQVQVRGLVEDRLVFSAHGATGRPRPGGLGGTWHAMPRATPPEDSQPLVDRLPDGADEVGAHLIADHRVATRLDGGEEGAGRLAIWGRLRTEPDRAPVVTPAVLAFLADLVPLAVSEAAGVRGAGASLDNSIRLGDLVDCEWVLLDLEADFAVGGIGHGQARLWTPDGRLMAVASQSARMFTYDDFVQRLS